MNTDYTKKSLIKKAIRIANGLDMNVPLGPLFPAGSEVPVAIFLPECGEIDIYSLSSGLSDLFTRCNDGTALDTLIVRTPQLKMSLFITKSGKAALVPIVEKSSFVDTIGLIAATTMTGRGDLMIDRIKKCKQCYKFFIQKTRRIALFCENKCMWNHFNALR